MRPAALYLAAYAVGFAAVKVCTRAERIIASRRYLKWVNAL